MNKKLYSKFSILLNLMCILVIAWINIKIANRYLFADGKTQLLFGLVEILSFSYKYWFVGLSIGSIITSILGKRKKEGEKIFFISLTLSLISLIIIFIPLWRLIVQLIKK